MSASINNFWESIETVVGEVNEFYKKLLIQCCLNTYISFRGMKDDEMKILFDQVQKHIKDLKEDSSSYRELQKSLPNFSNDYQLTIVFMVTVRNIVEALNNKTLKEFESCTSRKKRRIVSSASSNNLNTSVNVSGDEKTELGEKLTQKYRQIMKTSTDFPFVIEKSSKSTEINQAFVISCPVSTCKFATTIYKEKTTSGFRFRLCNFERHMKSHLKHNSDTDTSFTESERENEEYCEEFLAEAEVIVVNQIGPSSD